MVDGGVAQPVDESSFGSAQQAQSVSSLSEATSSAETLATCNQELTTIGIKINKIAIVKLDITDVEVLRALAKGATIVSTRTLSAAAADTTLEIIFSALAFTSQAGRALGSLEALSSVSPQPTQLRAALIGGGRVLTAGGCDSREAQGR